MENYFYIPVNSLNFNNLLSSESISPQSFYEKRGYGFKRFEKIFLNPFNNSFLAYNKIPLIEQLKSDREEYPIYLAIPYKYLAEVKNKFENHEVIIIQIDKTLYINPFECFFITVSKKEKEKIIASTRRSLEVKNVENYFDNFRTLEELNFKTFDWNNNILESIYDVKSVNTDSLLNDQKINKFKGFLYGYMSGKLNEQPEEIVKAKFYYQEFINNFSLLMNELSSNLNNKKNHTIANNSNNFKLDFDKLHDLKERITILLDAFGENKIENVILENFNLTNDDIKRISVSTYKQSKKTILSILIDFVKSKQPNLNTVEDLLNTLLQNANELTRYSNSKLYSELENDFNSIRNLISQKINEIEKSINSKKQFKTIPIDVNNELNRLNFKLDELNSRENTCYQEIINELISRAELSSSDEIGQSRLEIIAQIGKSLKSLNYDDNSSEIIYLQKFYKSIKSIGVGFKINDSDNIALQSFACFLSRYSDNEKLLDFMIKNGFSENGLVYGIWGSAYGFANMSKIVTEPLSNNQNVFKLTADYLNNIIYKNKIEFDILKSIDRIEKTNNIAFLSKQNIKNQSSISSNLKIIIPNIALYSPKQHNKESKERIEKTQLNQIKKYSNNDYNDFVKEPKDSNYKSLVFIDLVIEKKLRLKDEWIEAIEHCFEKVSKEIKSGELFDSENSKISLFKELLTSKAKPIKGFGGAKIEEIVKIYKDYIIKNE